MRVTIVSDSFPPTINGVSYVAGWLASNLALIKSYEVTVVTAGEIYNSFKILNDKIRVIMIPVYPRDAFKLPILVRTPHNILQELRRAFLKADIVHAHNIHGLFTPIIISLFKPRTVIFQPHFGGMFFRKASKIMSKPYSIVASRISSQAQGHVFVSVYEKLAYENYIGRKVEGIVIPNPISNLIGIIGQEKELVNDEIILVYAGRLDHYKHPELLIDVALRVQKRLGSKIIVKYIGDGPARKRILQKISVLNNDIKILLLGRLDRKRYIEELASSHILILPSEGEAYAIVVGEALAAGLHVIVPKPWGLIWKHYCPSRVHLIERYDDVIGMSRIVAKLYQDNSPSGRCWVPSEDIVFKLYINYYNRLIY